ncbi:uncharacterized protein LOC129230403 [Uloborus diversus]|uniref:uncharacterized protein LOC129230403 n=1 Tax=Uloborus diversus TaxID=327109 RepID=UPI00240A4638|nr:uncharacterized protein LOC129230403 [Uloborus diversus]
MSTRFPVDSLQCTEFKDWIQSVPNDIHKARCSIGKKTFTLSNMGRRALRSHAKGTDRKKRVKERPEILKLTPYFSNKSKERSHIAESNVVTTSMPDSSRVVSSFSLEPSISSLASSSSSLAPSRALKTFLINDSVVKAEILWCLQTIMTHKSLRATSADVLLLQNMFTDSLIAQKMQLQRTKIAYSILYGIAPYFKDNLLRKLSDVKCFTVGFDESLNKVSQRTQTDINVRFWNLEKSEVSTRFLTSMFLTSTTSDALRTTFKDALKPILNIKYIVQIAMDGPNVNQKIFRDQKEEIQSEDEANIISIGTCGLHTMHLSLL